MSMNDRPVAAAAFLLSLAVGLLASCDLQPDSFPPFVLGKPECVIGERPGYYLVAGIEFEFANTSGKSIRSLSVSAMVYDRETESNPFVGSNRIEGLFAGDIPGKSKIDAAIPLDSYIYVAPSEPYIVDFFYVSAIEYSDGTSWADPNGAYCTGSEP